MLCSLCFNTVLLSFDEYLILKSVLGGGGGNSKKVNTHPKIPEIDLDFFRLF